MDAPDSDGVLVSVLRTRGFRWAYAVSLYAFLFVGIELGIQSDKPRLHVADSPVIDSSLGGIQLAARKPPVATRSGEARGLSAKSLIEESVVNLDEAGLLSTSIPARPNPIRKNQRVYNLPNIYRLNIDSTDTDEAPKQTGQTLAALRSVRIVQPPVQTVPIQPRTLLHRIAFRSSATGRIYYRYVSIAPVRNRFATSKSSLRTQIAEVTADGELSDAEIQRRLSENKRRLRELAAENRRREKLGRGGEYNSYRKRPRINLAEYKAWLASKYGINNLVEHYKSSVSIAPFSMKHVGQHLGLGGGIREGSGYSARSPWEALAACSYSRYGFPVLYQGVAKGIDGYYAYKIYGR